MTADFFILYIISEKSRRAVAQNPKICYNIVMLIADFFSWWYGRGWRAQVGRIGASLRRTSDTFSILLLLRTLFDPFRQISADDSGRSLGEKVSAMFNRLFSRCIGAIMRLFMIIAGIISLLLISVLSLLRLILWPVLPALPAVGALLMLTIGTPWN
jgi:hypothetical protein